MSLGNVNIYFGILSRISGGLVGYKSFPQLNSEKAQARTLTPFR